MVAVPHFLVIPTQLMKPDIDQNAFCQVGDVV